MVLSTSPQVDDDEQVLAFAKAFAEAFLMATCPLAVWYPALFDKHGDSD